MTNMAVARLTFRFAVEAENLSRRYGRTWALRRVSLTIAPGESVALLGANGAGKSTLLKVIATVLAPTRGRLHVFDMDPRGDGDAVRGRLGLKAHQSYSYGDLTALENLRFAASMYEIRRSEAELREALDAVGLAGAADRLARTFSQGMRERLALARAALHHPDLLLLDEPYGGLDPEGAAVVDRLVEARRSTGRTTILVTHHVERALELCGRAVALRGGRVVFDGPAREYAPTAAAAVPGGAA